MDEQHEEQRDTLAKGSFPELQKAIYFQKMEK